MSEYCNACRAWHLNGRGHYPLFEARMADRDDWIPIRALDAEQAAERYMEYAWTHYDGWEWIIPRGGEGEHTVSVKTADGEIISVHVSAEMRPHYSCREMTP